MFNCEGRKRCGCCEKHTAIHENTPSGMVSLNDAPEHKRMMVGANSDIKTMEMGLYPGSIVSLVHNNHQERNIIVKIHDQRYVIPRETASGIMVKVC